MALADMITGKKKRMKIAGMEYIEESVAVRIDAVGVELKMSVDYVGDALDHRDIERQDLAPRSASAAVHSRQQSSITTTVSVRDCQTNFPA
jgi:hypothetical protein